ncbi:MAG: FHA domain-containing protein [Deltaproteobacteria bacterium]|nr:FHA domain-containing protein [Deltaproteobacteria bacterium]
MGPVLAEVQLVDQGVATLTLVMDGAGLLVGRAPDVNLRLPDPRISGRHLALYYGPGRRTLMAQDLGSTNGTWLHGEPLVGPTQLHAGEELLLGLSRVLRVNLMTAPPLEEQDRPLQLLDLSGGIAHALEEVGGVILHHLPLPELSYTDEGLALGEGPDRLLLSVGEPFRWGGRLYLVRELAG